MAPTLRHEVECLDRWLYSRAGLKFWLFFIAALAGLMAGFTVAGLPWLLAIPAGMIASVPIVIASLSAWLQPERYTSAKILKFTVVGLVLAEQGAICGFVVAHAAKHSLDFAALPGLLLDAVRRTTPAMLLMLALIGLLMYSVAAVKRFRTEREITSLRIVQERDAIARQLAEARLKLLQGQIQPHFIFNTLAAVQHWVDQGDPRAASLLRALTGFLRGSTELLTQESTPFSVELQMVRDYLAVMESRLGGRLRHAITIGSAAEAQSIPPGLLLTLVENAIDHGISPALDGGRIDITAEVVAATWTLRVSDDGAGPVDGWAEGVGLTNCRERLHHLFDGRASLTMQRIGDSTVAEVRIDAGGIR